jgi:hypothetical protein
MFYFERLTFSLKMKWMSLTNRLQKTDALLSEIETLFETYVKEMKYLRNFSEGTLVGYRDPSKNRRNMPIVYRQQRTWLIVY